MRPSPLVAILVLGCAGATIQLSPSNAPTPTPSVHEADALVSLSTGCFMGPRFGAPADPRMLARNRCTDVLLRAWGTADAGHRARLRSLDPDEVGALRGRLADFGATRSQLTAFDRIARARREAVLVGRGAVIDALGPSSDATPEPSDATLALFAANLGDTRLEAELRTIAFMSALERMDAVAGMPRAIKAEALAGLFHAFYGVERPNSSSAMEWLAYLEAISAELGHVPDAGNLDGREAAASWATVRAAIGRDIAAAAESLPDSDLRRTAMAAAARVGVKRNVRAPVDEGVDRDAHAIVLHAATCWLDVRFDSRACATLARVVHDDPALAFEAEESMRFAQPGAIEMIAGAVRTAGGSSVDRDIALLQTTGTVAREAQRVRWATAALSADEEQPVCVRTLGESTNLVAMLGARNASSEARAIGLVFAADRLWTARGLPDELELRVAAPVLATLTGDAVATSFERTARATGRRIPYSHSEDFDDAHISLARASVGEAIADRLRVLPVGAPLSDVTRSVVLRLDIEYRAALAHYDP